ncbi:PepSY-like domain-containing protein [Zobellia roscoffensis]|uniref:PepSY-like domain-containing protein n=1 Tax=Zobellia roscoffensis TaxID=2779508 RepID=UPI00188D9C6D|nr:PepSY-like domain-containing protein [Zobellia roscoffensis]
MEKLKFFTAILSLGIISCDNNDDDFADNDSDILNSEVPAVVKSAFEDTFSNATDVEWETIGESYNVDFDMETVEYEALYEASGTLTNYKYDIAASELPEAVKTAIVNDYDNKQIDDAEVLIVGENTYYQIELDKEPTDLHLVFNQDGNVNTEVVFVN